MYNVLVLLSWQIGLLSKNLGKLATHRHNCNKINSEHTSMTESSIQCTAQKPLYNPRLQRPKLQPTENSWFGELTETPQFRSSMQHWPTEATHFEHTAASTEYRPVRRQQRSTPWCIITDLLERKEKLLAVLKNLQVQCSPDLFQLLEYSTSSAANNARPAAILISSHLTVEKQCPGSV